MLSEISQYISDRIISFKVQACNNAYVGLISGTDETDPLYEIAIGTYSDTQSLIRIGKDYSAPKLSENTDPVLDCSAYTEFCITWDDNTINVRRGLDVTGSLFLSWTSDIDLWPILNVGICTTRSSVTANWIFYVQDNLQTTTSPSTEIATQISASSLGTTTISSSTLTPPTAIDELASSTTTNDAPTTSDSSTMTEQKTSTTSDVYSPKNLKTTATALSTSKATPCPASCTKTYTCHCQTTTGSSYTVTDLKIDTKTLSSYKRRHQSVSDSRKSSFYIGCVGIMVLVLFLAFIVLLDFLPRA
ncbi:Hypothetical predicted protein [Mytilus galloprovincialis]|uniref:Farnesoic acid O-methyl transferase domain-containing protein n=1 Tax=Mytilus galloprovincialis TaxID=29158 RepID=A0A8B6H2S1_MYTGA|nr:Hypothetical predicted protein [Mytilus galloprovincialis]